MHKRYHYLAAITLAGLLLPSIAPALAFDPNNLLSNAELTDTFALDLNGIQEQLSRGTLIDLKTPDYTGKIRYAADIIWRAAQTYQISPKFLIVLLQKEQSLIEDPSPSQKQLDWATGYGVCDVCLLSDSSIQRWSGFGKQVNSAAAQFRQGYLADLANKGVTSAGIRPGKATTIDGQTVIPANDATAALYSYTPHFEGNENFVAIWDRYFEHLYPDGSLLEAKGDKAVWLIRGNEKRQITSHAALESRFDPNAIITVDASTLQQYTVGAPIAFANYSLLRAPTGTVYLIVDDRRRGFDSLKTFKSVGFSTDEITDVAWSDLEPYTEGTPITMDTLYPQGHLLQDATTGGVYFVQDNVKHAISSKAILNANFAGWRIHSATQKDLAVITTGDPVLLPDGTLVQASGDTAVYVISNGERRPIPSADVFNAMGWKWKNILTVDQKTLNLHPLGDPISAAAATVGTVTSASN